MNLVSICDEPRSIGTAMPPTRFLHPQLHFYSQHTLCTQVCVACFTLACAASAVEAVEGDQVEAIDSLETFANAELEVLRAAVTDEAHQAVQDAKVCSCVRVCVHVSVCECV